MTQKLHAGNDAVLAEGKAANPVITAGTQPACALVALDESGILGMVSAIQHLLSSFSSVLRPVPAILGGAATLLRLLFLLAVALVWFWSSGLGGLGLAAH